MRAITEAMFPVILLSALGLGAGHALAQEKAAPDPAAVEALQKLATRWTTLANARDAAGVAALYTTDARFYDAVTSAIGRDAILKHLQAVLPVGKDFAIELSDTEVAGDVAYCTGTYHMTIVTDKGTQSDQGDFLVVGKRQPDGSWLLARHMDISRNPPAAAPKK